MTEDLHSQAREIAETAGRVLLSMRKDLSASGVDPRELKDRGDQASQEVLAAELTLRYPRDAVLSEEAADDSRRLDAERVWIIDPLDGTREFSEVPRDDWAVHVALWRRGSWSPAPSPSPPAA